MEFDPESNGVVSAEVSPHRFTNGDSFDSGQVEVDSIKGKLLTTIAGDVGWLVKEETGEFPRARTEGPND